MDVLIEFLLSLILESSFELARSKRVSKWVRYPLIVLLSLLVLSLIIGTPVLGVYLIAVTGGSFGVTMGVILLALSALIIYLFVRKVRAVMSSRSSLSFDLLDISDESSVNELSSMASEIWHEHYESILGRAQVDYMVERFLSPAAIKEQVGEGYSYRFAVAKGRKVGFFAYYPREGALYLSKLYLYKTERGKGYSRAILDHLKEVAASSSLPAIELNVNKHNDASIAVYEKLGFTRLREEKIDIGGGFFMDDYVYRFDLAEGEGK